MPKIIPAFAVRFHNTVAPSAVLGIAAVALCALPAPAAPHSPAKPVAAVHPMAVKPVAVAHPTTARSIRADTQPMAPQPNAQAFTAATDSPFRPILHYQALWNGVQHAFYLRVEDADHRMIIFKITDSHEFAMVQLILSSPGGAQTDGRSISSNLTEAPSK
jgi:hypothetical protein